MTAIVPDGIIPAGGQLEVIEGRRAPADLAAALAAAGIDVAAIDPDRLRANQAEADRIIAQADLSDTTAAAVLAALAGFVKRLDEAGLLAKSGWDGRSLPIPWELVFWDLVESRRNGRCTASTASHLVWGVGCVNRQGRWPDQAPSEALDSRGWETLADHPQINVLLTGWDRDLPRRQCRALIRSLSHDPGRGSEQVGQQCRASTASGDRCQRVTKQDHGRCKAHRDAPTDWPFASTGATRRCQNFTTRPDEMCHQHQCWERCRADSAAGDRCHLMSNNGSGLCSQHQGCEPLHPFEAGPVADDTVRQLGTRKARPIRAAELEQTTTPDPKPQHDAEIIHALRLLRDFGQEPGPVARVGREAFRFGPDDKWVIIEVPSVAFSFVSVADCTEALIACRDELGTEPTLLEYEAWRQQKPAARPTRMTIGKRLGNGGSGSDSWSQALDAAYGRTEPPPEPYPPETVGPFIANVDPRRCPVRAIRAVLANPDCDPDRPLGSLPASQPDSYVRRYLSREEKRARGLPESDKVFIDLPAGDATRFSWRVELRDCALIRTMWWWGIRRNESCQLQLSQLEPDPDTDVLWLVYRPEANKTNRDDRVGRRCTCDTEVNLVVSTETVEGTDDTGPFRRTTTTHRPRPVQRPGICPLKIICEWIACDWWLDPPDECGHTALIWLKTFLEGLTHDQRNLRIFPPIRNTELASCGPADRDPDDRLDVQMPSRIIRKLAARHGFEWASTHSARRGQAHEQRAAGVDIDTLMADLGWISEAVARGYIDDLPSERVNDGQTALLALVLTDDDVA